MYLKNVIITFNEANILTSQCFMTHVDILVQIEIYQDKASYIYRKFYFETIN